MPKHIYVDITDLGVFVQRNHRVSGIQRVVLNVVGHLLHTMQSDCSITAVFYHQTDKVFYKVDPEFLLPSRRYSVPELQDALGKQPPKAINLDKYDGKPFKRRFHKFRNSLRSLVFNFRAAPELGSALAEPVSFKAGDVYLFMGAGWDVPWLMPELVTLQEKKGVELVFFIHDLIPVFTAESDSSMHRRTFLSWLETVTPFVKRYMTCSNFTKRDLERYLQDREIGGCSISVTPLAHEFISDTKVEIRPEIENLKDVDYVLFVGPVIGRKNANKLIDAWARLKQDVAPDALPRLVLAGNQKGKEALAAQLTDAGRTMLEDVVFLHNPNDSELEWLYRNCSFSCFPSSYEGWGLPVGESLWFGRYCITSNATSLPEVGGDLVDVFDLSEEDGLYNTLKKPIEDREYLSQRNSRIKRSGLRSWQQTAANILSVVNERASND